MHVQRLIHFPPLEYMQYYGVPAFLYTGDNNGFRWLLHQQDSGRTREGLLCLRSCHHRTVHQGSIEDHIRQLPVGRGTSDQLPGLLTIKVIASLVPRPHSRRSGLVSTVFAGARIFGKQSVNVSVIKLSHMAASSMEAVHG